MILKVILAFLNERILWFYYNQLHDSRAESADLREGEVLGTKVHKDHNEFKDSDGS